MDPDQTRLNKQYEQGPTYLNTNLKVKKKNVRVDTNHERTKMSNLFLLAVK